MPSALAVQKALVDELSGTVFPSIYVQDLFCEQTHSEHHQKYTCSPKELFAGSLWGHFEVPKQFGNKIKVALKHQSRSKLKLSFRLDFCMHGSYVKIELPSLETKRNTFLYCNNS